MAVALVTVGWWSGNIISGELSPFLLTSLGTAGTLLLHSGVCVLAFLFILLLLPETKVCIWDVIFNCSFLLLIHISHHTCN